MDGENDQNPVKHEFKWNPSMNRPISFLGMHGDFSFDLSEQHEVPGKIKTSKSHRQARQKASTLKRQFRSNPRDAKKLQHAVEKGDTSEVKALLENGADPSGSDDKCRTPLHIAAAKGDENLVTLLLGHGADPSKADMVGNTPLHLAACTNQIRIITLLLRAGTDVNALDITGRSPLHLATGRLRLLKSHESYSNTQLKQEVTNIIEMMREYLSKSKSDVIKLNEYQEKLTDTSDRNDIDEINDLLSNFAGMQLTKPNQPS